MRKTVVIVGGGASGFFAAANIANLNADWKVVLLEKGGQFLGKVKISGGGRCNVTHACFDPKRLVQFYPRGSRELLGPFHRFQASDTVEWFESRGVQLKTEADGRMFPTTDSSQTIIDCLVNEAVKGGVELRLHSGMVQLEHAPSSLHAFRIGVNDNESLEADALVIATGSSNLVWKKLEELGHQLVEPVPSLFTFNIADPRINQLPGISVPNATVQLEGSALLTDGPLLITHWGLSGPAILKMSAIAARELAQRAYHFNIKVSWKGDKTPLQWVESIHEMRKIHSSRQVKTTPMEALPSRLWNSLIPLHVLDKRWADLSKAEILELGEVLGACVMEVNGKSTFKEEFVTAGGIELKEVNFKTMESRICPRLHFAGELLDIDGITGGFNFQAAWTTGWIAGKAMAAT